MMVFSGAWGGVGESGGVGAVGGVGAEGASGRVGLVGRVCATANNDKGFVKRTKIDKSIIATFFIFLKRFLFIKIYFCTFLSMLVTFTLEI